MRPFSCLAISLLVLFIVLYCVHGIRLEKSFKSAEHLHRHHHHKLNEGGLAKNSNEVIGDVIVCKEGHCSSTGDSRKLVTATTAITPTSDSATTLKSEEITGENKANLTSKVKPDNINGGKKDSFQEELLEQYYADLIDITEIDYSPSRKRPPIHN